MIQNELLNQTAGSVSEKISSIYLNEDTKVTNFDKMVVDNLVTVSFDIPQEIDELKHVKFLDEDGKTLSESDVYVRTVDNTRFSYKLEVLR